VVRSVDPAFFTDFFSLSSSILTILFFDEVLMDDLGVSTMSSSGISNMVVCSSSTSLPSRTNPCVVISVSFKVVMFSVFFMKSVNILNLSSSDILFGVVNEVGWGVVRRKGRVTLLKVRLLKLPVLAVVCGGGSVVLAVVNGGKSEFIATVVSGGGSTVGLNGFFVGLPVVGLRKIGFLGLNLFLNKFLRLPKSLFRLDCIPLVLSFRLESLSPSSLSPSSCPNKDSFLPSDSFTRVVSLGSTLLVSIRFPSSESSGITVSFSIGAGVVDLRRVKMPLILSFNFLVRNLGVVRGVLTVVDRAKLGLLGKKDPGRLEGKNKDLLVDDDPGVVSVVVIAVVSNLIIVVWRCVDDMPASGVED